MKFRWNSQEERDTKKKGWHLWFAWYPISVGPEDWRWLERVERIGTFIPITPVTDAESYVPWHWDYRGRLN